MSLADEIAAEAAPKQHPCAICRLLDELDTDDAKTVQEKLATTGAGRVPTAAIQRALAKRGHKFSASTWNDHRRDCQ